MGQVSKRNHYISKFRLRYFATDEIIWVYDKKKDEIRKQHIKDVAVKNNLHRHKIAGNPFTSIHDTITEDLQDGYIFDELIDDEVLLELKKINISEDTIKEFIKNMPEVMNDLKDVYIELANIPEIKNIFSTSDGMEQFLGSDLESKLANIHKRLIESGNIDKKESLFYSTQTVFLHFFTLKILNIANSDIYLNIGYILQKLSEMFSQCQYYVLKINCNINFYQLMLPDTILLTRYQRADKKYVAGHILNILELEKDLIFDVFIPLSPNKLLYISNFPLQLESKDVVKNLFLEYSEMCYHYSERFVFGKSEENIRQLMNYAKSRKDLWTLT